MTSPPPPPGRDPHDGADRWFVPLDPREGARVRIFAFPHAGGGCAAFAGCARRLPAAAELWSLNLPGRQARFGEPPRTELKPLVEELTSAIRSSLAGPYLLLGYCSGALLAYLVTRRLLAAGGPTPAGLVIVSYAAPDRVRPPAELHRLPTEAFWAKLLALGGFPAELVAEEGYREVFEPALRADFALLAQYRYDPEPPLDLPITVIGGRSDSMLPLEDLGGWLRHTSAEFTLRLLRADHWLLERATDSLAVALARELPPAG